MSPTKLQTGFLTKDFLRFWMVDICREGHRKRSSPPEETQGTLDLALMETEAGTGRGEVVLHLKRVGSSSSWFSDLLGRRRHKTQAQPSLPLCEVPKNLNLSGLGLGSARNSGPTPWRAAWSLSSVDGESTQAVSGGKPSVAGTL
ncbi:unnamed protein product [Rangifer tarandus platyrhynchus]|uniref:Uncharacterized protein n=1 Tax=Rangifer tarandus platyrhynchus TaxID=3082113 RepID=A0ABN9A378_RANTA|nr:unnamed protein product [Rangifer tarandus platyrhynchus]